MLTAAGVITRILGFVYRIYMSNLMGAEGMGLYQLIMPVYALAWSISCAGFNTTVSKLTAQERAKGEYGNMGRVLKQSVVITTLMGFVLTAALYFGAELLAVHFFNDMRVVLPLRILSFAFPAMAAGTCLRGYFIGLQEAKIPAANQVLEQIVRMVIVYVLAARFVPRGLEYAAAVAFIAIVGEEIFSFGFTYISYRIFKKRRRLFKRPTLTSAQTLGLIMTMALPLTGNRVAGSLLTAWENVLIPARLQLYGLSASEAISEFGRITGMAMPLIFFPTAVLTALSVTLVPAVAEAAAAGNMRRISYATSKGLLFASVTGMGAASLFLFFSHELGMAIYNQPIGLMLQLLGIMCPFIYMHIILSGVLNGLGCQLFIFRNSIISSAITIAFTFFLVPHFGLPAYIFGWLLSLVVVIALGMHKVRQHIDYELPLVSWLVKPLLAAAIAGALARLLANRLLLDALGLRIGLGLAIGVLVLVYFWGILLSGCISRAEVKALFTR
ncbi:MAG: polysaccharide biosynthesis protein [Defluviitaleaceae bacterium]|nr:polysaccharide biosynthesis protein [Defluviitaleaceae bacterium]MCL2239466.1 polysaccharide biosynthesis protein [Defluviitaleaceae bacterium]